MLTELDRFVAFQALALLLSQVPSAVIAEECKLIVASRTSLTEGKELAIDYSRKFQEVELLEARNGRFAISLGTVPYKSGSDMSHYIIKYGLPSDTFCMNMGSVTRLISFESTPQEQDTVLPTENYFGTKTCPRGYKPRGFPIELCDEIVVPENAELDYTGNGWRCSEGYIQRQDHCEYVVVPENAHLTPNLLAFPNSKGWACDHGYSEKGSKCERVFVPENATLNAFGNGYDCDTGFRDSGNQCRPMTYDELFKELEKTEQIVMLLMMRNAGKSCSQIIDLCEDTCDDDFSSYSSPSENECEEVCEAIEDNC